MVFANNSDSGFPGSFPEAGIFFKSNAYDFMTQNCAFNLHQNSNP